MTNSPEFQENKTISKAATYARNPVLLVGAGPGAADLITVRGARALQAAEVVLYDDLANAELLGLCGPEAEKIYVGKRAGLHSVKQGEINTLLVEKARTGPRQTELFTIGLRPRASRAKSE